SVTKFPQGTWIVLLLIPAQMAIFLAINRHYRRVESEVALAEQAAPARPLTYKHTFIVPVAGLSPVALSALAYARSLASRVIALHVVEGENPQEADKFIEEWHKAVPKNDIGLVIIESPYRSFQEPLLTYIDALDREDPDDTITIVIPEFVPRRFWEYFVHNQTALRLKLSLLFRQNTVVMNLPYHQVRRAEEARGSPMLQYSWVPALFAL